MPRNFIVGFTVTTINRFFDCITAVFSEKSLINSISSAPNSRQTVRNELLSSIQLLKNLKTIPLSSCGDRKGEYQTFIRWVERLQINNINTNNVSPPYFLRRYNVTVIWPTQIKYCFSFQEAVNICGNNLLPTA